MAEGAFDAGMAKNKIVIGTKEQIVTRLSDSLQPGDWVLVKGSRAMTMETIVAAIVKAGGGAVEGTERRE